MVVARDRLSVLGLAAGPNHLGVEAFDLPAFLFRGTLAVADGGDAVLDVPLVQYRPESEVPAVLTKQRTVPDVQKPRRLVRVQVEVHLKEPVITGHASPPRLRHAHILRACLPEGFDVQVITQHSYLYVTFSRFRGRRNLSASRKTNQESGETLSSSTWKIPTVVALATGVLLAAFFGHALEGQPMASGQPCDADACTVAHKSCRSARSWRWATETSPCGSPSPTAVPTSSNTTWTSPWPRRGRSN